MRGLLQFLDSRDAFAATLVLRKKNADKLVYLNKEIYVSTGVFR